MSNTEYGTVIRWNDGAGFGFIKRDAGGPDVFLHAADCSGGAPEVGQRLRFEVTQTDRGARASAIEILPDRNGGRR